MSDNTKSTKEYMEPWVEFVESCANHHLDSPDCGKGCIEEIKDRARELLASLPK